MKRPESIEKQLQRNELARLVIELMVGLIFLAQVVAVGFVAYEFTDPENPLRELAAGALALLWFGISHPPAVSLSGRIANHYFPSYVIEEGSDVIKLHGSYLLINRPKIELLLLSKREGYKLVGKPFEQYGCSMAAIPNTDRLM